MKQEADLQPEMAESNGHQDPGAVIKHQNVQSELFFGS